MEIPPDGPPSVTDLRSPPPSRARRRLVQSTLFPHTPLDDTCTTAQDCQKDEHDKIMTQLNPKPTPRSSAPSEVLLTKEDTPSKGMDKEEDSHPLDDNLKSPQKRKRLSTASPEKRRTSATPKKRGASATPKKRGASATPEKLRKNSTTKKKLLVSGLNDGCSGKMNNPTHGEHASQSVPDLRLEAKLQAEENSRLYGGRQIHPFFSPRKTVKRAHERTDDESNWSPVNKGKSFSFSPIHVFEQVKDDDLSLDWGNWTFLERSESTNFDFENEPLAKNERTVKALHFDNFLNLSGCRNDGSSYQCPIQVDKVPLHHSPIRQDYLNSTSSVVLNDEQVADHERSIERKEIHNTSKTDPYTVDAGCVQNSDVNCGDIFYEEKMMSYGLNCVNQLQNSLWTTKYQPEKANEICSNGESVNSLNDWLRLWNEKGLGKNKIVGNMYSEQDAEYYHTCESDSEDMNEENRLKNVLLITGPVGSGKSAAIYACAKEQGFQVIEVNASDWRNGALVKQRFGEAVESHWLQCATADQGISNEVIEVIPLSESENSDGTMMTHAELVSKRSKSSSDQNDKKTLILFEDVDAVLEEDRGFIGTIQQLAGTAKRPMILTSNSNNPVLPNSLDRLELCFSKPSLEELLCLVSMVCSAEKVTIPPFLMKRFIESCHRDIRKTILHLQFWCQGQTYIRDRKILGAYGMMVFDTDAGHNMIPKMISCDYPSQLSEIVDKAITKSILEVEEASHLNGIDEEEPNISGLGALKFRPNSIDASKEAMLSWDQDRNELPSQLGAACELSSSSGSPIAFSRQGIPRRTETVLSSESGEECSRGSCPFVPAKVFKEEHLEEHREVITNGPSHCFAPVISDNTLTEQLIRDTKDFAPLNGMCRSVDVSCVSDSSYVPETEFCIDTLSWGRNVYNTAETAYVKNDLPVNDINLNMAPSGLHEILAFTKTRSDEITNSVREVEERVDSRINCSETALANHEFPVHGIDLNVSPSGSYEVLNLLRNNDDANTVSETSQEVADSHVQCVRAVPTEYQGMDDCNRFNIGMRSKFKKYRNSLEASDTVRETWRRLRHCHRNLQQYAILEPEDASKVLNLAHGLCNLISEANMLLSDCQLLTCDYLEPSMVPCEKSHSLSWHDDHLKMVSTMLEHAMCLYAKDIDAASTDMLSAGIADLTWEMLASSTSTMALGKLVNRDSKRIQNLEMGPQKSGIPSQRKSALSLCCVVQSLIPKRSYLSAKGNALHEYLSSLSQISRSEDNRLSESFKKSTKRRVRAARNYLSNAAPSLTPEDISMLSQYCNYQKVSQQFSDDI